MAGSIGSFGPRQRSSSVFPVKFGRSFPTSSRLRSTPPMEMLNGAPDARRRIGDNLSLAKNAGRSKVPEKTKRCFLSSRLRARSRRKSRVKRSMLTMPSSTSFAKCRRSKRESETVTALLKPCGTQASGPDRTVCRLCNQLCNLARVHRPPFIRAASAFPQKLMSRTKGFTERDANSVSGPGNSGSGFCETNEIV